MWSWTRGNWLTLARLAWVALAVAFAVLAFFHPYSHTVYPIYAPASRRWWLGEDIYARLTEYYRYSPLFAILLTPLASLPDCWGGSIWKALNIAVYAIGLASACRHLLPVRPSRNQLAALWLLALPLSLHSMYNGQANLIMLGTTLLGLSAAARGHWNWAALWLALATLIKGYPLALALLLSALYLRPFALRYALFLAAGLLLPFATQPPNVVAEQYASWYRHLTDSTMIMRERLRSIDYLFLCYKLPISPRTFMFLGVLGGAGALGVCLLWARRLTEPRALLTRVYLLFAVWVVLFGPATETCTYVILGPALGWAIVEAFHAPGALTRRSLLPCSLFLMGPSVTDLVGQTLRNLAYAYAAQPVGALLFVVLLLTQGTPRGAPAAATDAATKRPTQLAA
jgi:hypothetical protein